MAPIPIQRALAELPDSGLTVRVLRLLDFVAPGEWKNITDLEAMVRDVTGETDDAYIQEIGEHAMALYADPEEGYQRALKIYGLVDTIDKVAGAASLASQVGERVKFLKFISKLTPKDETTQAIDAAAKFAAEIAAFYYLNGTPGDTVRDFAKSLKRYGGANGIRLGAWIAIDGVLPLGPDFVDAVAERLKTTSDSQVKQHALFSAISEFLPGNSISQSKGMVLEALSETRDTIKGWIAERGITRDGLASKLEGFVDVTDKRLDLVAAGLDVSTNYFEHTGTQSVARQLVDRAYGEV